MWLSPRRERLERQGKEREWVTCFIQHCSDLTDNSVVCWTFDIPSRKYILNWKPALKLTLSSIYSRKQRHLLSGFHPLIDPKFTKVTFDWQQTCEYLTRCKCQNKITHIICRVLHLSSVRMRDLDSETDPSPQSYISLNPAIIQCFFM